MEIINNVVRKILLPILAISSLGFIVAAVIGLIPWYGAVYISGFICWIDIYI